MKLVGDIDGDGFPDLVLGGLPDDGLAWWHWPDLARHMIATPQVEFTTDGALADLDDDGDPDVVVPDGPAGENLVWFENPRSPGGSGAGDKWLRRSIGAIGNWGKDVEVGDFDQDGLPDVAARSPTALLIFFRQRRGAWHRVSFPAVELCEEGMTSGDVDGDGDVDLVLCGVWVANPGRMLARQSRRWDIHRVGRFSPAFKALVADIDGDGRADIVTSSSEHTADVTWFRADDGPTGGWTPHVVQSAVQGAHTLQAADMDNDGDMDIVSGQMHTTAERRLVINFNVDGRGTRWQQSLIDTTGLHNGVVADIDRDGDFDVYGSNWAGNPGLHVWLNALDPPAHALRLDRWSDHVITDDHARSFGLSFADVDGDGLSDVISGPFWYRQPPDFGSRPWEQNRLGDALDAVLAGDIDGDGRTEIIAQHQSADGLQFVWLEPRSFDTRIADHLMGNVPSASHELGSQGHALVQIEPGGTPEVAVSSGAGIYYFASSASGISASWRRVRICGTASDEGLAFDDIDGDGLPDLVATTGEGRTVRWWRNPGDRSADWQAFPVGTFPEAVFPDRVATADLDGDGLKDVIVTEENGEPNDAQAYWWRHPKSLGSEPWDRHLITSRGSLNSLAVADMDGDGDTDIVLGEHRGALRISIWNNLGAGDFAEQLVATGVESHLGARTVDIDGDGDLDIVSIAWDRPGQIHVLRNDATGAPSN